MTASPGSVDAEDRRLGDRRTRHGWLQLFATAAVLAGAFWSNPALDPEIEVDTGSYVAVADSLHSEWARDRPPGYPFLLRVMRDVADDSWPQATVLVQMVLLAAVAALVFDGLRRASVPGGRAAIAAVFSSLTPGLLRDVRFVLPELLLGVLITACWDMTLALQAPGAVRSGSFLDGVALGCGLLSGAAALVKPVWLLGIFPLVGGVVLLRRGCGAKRRLRTVVWMLAGHFVVVGAWQAFLVHAFDQRSLSRVGSINLNLVAIRSGFTGDAAGTKLYGFLDREGLLGQALGMRWPDLEGFTRLKDRIPWEERIDPAFGRAVLQRDGALLAWQQLRRSPGFLLVHEPALAEGSFPGMPSILRRVYERLYSVVVRIDFRGIRVPVIVLWLAAAVMWGFRRPPLRALLVTSLLVVVYLGAVVVFLTYQNSHFIRMRVACEPVLFAMLLAPWLLPSPRRRALATAEADPGHLASSP